MVLRQTLARRDVQRGCQIGLGRNRFIEARGLCNAQKARFALHHGYFAHEFIPVGDPITGLTDAVKLCLV